MILPSTKSAMFVLQAVAQQRKEKYARRPVSSEEPVQQPLRLTDEQFEEHVPHGIMYFKCTGICIRNH